MSDRQRKRTLRPMIPRRLWVLSLVLFLGLRPSEVSLAQDSTGSFCALGQNIRAVSRQFVDHYARVTERGTAREVALADFYRDDNFWPRISFFVIIGSLGSEESCEKLNRVLTLPFVAGEAARTDKQLGAGPSSSGTTSVTEKPGLPRILALAVEYGAVQQETSGASLTLSTTPYVVVPFLDEDTAANYQRFDWLHRVGFSATASLDDRGNRTSDDLKYKDFSQLSGKLRLIGDRSTRSAKFVEMWLEQFGPKFDKLLSEQTRAYSVVFNSYQDLRTAQNAGGMWAHEELARRLTGSESIEESVDTVANVIATALDTYVKPALAPIIADEDKREEANDKFEIDSKLVPDIVNAYQDLYGENREAYQARYKKLIEELNRTPLLTLIYTNNRVEGGSDYSEVKLSFDGCWRKADFILNGAISFNQNPKGSMDENTVRDYGAAITIERDVPLGRIFPKFGPDDLTAVRGSISGKFTYNEDVEDPIGTVQAKIEIPFAMGFRLPFAITYSTRSEGKNEDELKFNIGSNFDVDTLLAQLVGG
jgi:hypothetical protein